MLRKPEPTRSLVPQLHAVGLDDEITAAAADQIDRRLRVSIPNRSGQTDRFRLVASHYAVFDCDVHTYAYRVEDQRAQVIICARSDLLRRGGGPTAALRPL